MRSILLCIDGSTYARTAAEYARQIAVKMRTSVKALHVEDARILESPILADLAGSMGAQPYLALAPQIQEMLRNKSVQIGKGMEELFQGSGVDFSFRSAAGRLAATVLEEETASDLVILGKRGEHEQDDDQLDMLGPSIEWIVRRSVKPCMVTPWRYREIERVAVAYDGSAHSASAVKKAMQLVKGMGLSLSLVTVRPVGDAVPPWQTILEEGRNIVSEEGVECQTHLAHGHADEEILQFVNDAEIDLLVMGAYGHTRIREFLMGSTTFQVLLRAQIPIYLIR